MSLELNPGWYGRPGMKEEVYLSKKDIEKLMAEKLKPKHTFSNTKRQREQILGKFCSHVWGKKIHGAQHWCILKPNHKKAHVCPCGETKKV